MSLMLIDAGNACVKWAIGDGGEFDNVQTAEIDNGSDAAIASVTKSVSPGIETAVIGNVAGAQFGERLARALGTHDLPVWFAGSRRESAGVRNAYAQPDTLGVDRWAAIIAGFRRGKVAAPGRPVCIADAGTALTIDAVTPAGKHLGGIILPGLRLQRAALLESTADIAVSSSRAAATPAGTTMFSDSTAAALERSGPLAFAAVLERCAAVLAKEYGDPWVVLTGGDAAVLASWLATAFEICPNLVLEGLAMLFEQESSG